MVKRKKRIAVLGYGKLGQFLVEKIREDGRLELAALWNRTPVKDEDSRALLKGVTILEDFENIQVDLIVEVCHPAVIASSGERLLQQADLLVGSSTSLVDDQLRGRLQETARAFGHRLIIGRGALWAANDIQRMARQGLLEAVRVRMHFHPRSLRLPADSSLKAVVDELLLLLKNSSEESSSSKSPPPPPVILYSGPVRAVCPLAPNNVNTMATAALLGVGLDRTEGVLVADPGLADHHRIEVEVRGVQRSGFSRPFSASSTRISPTSAESSVSSRQTLDAFWQSVLDALGELDDHGQIRVC
ncbi:hypothetical protein TYRP_003773 [Tyrophagus putrescentiae]|nr:hypothetical protein TYRP_003773 [Tyrophagus putrescentiae]